ncbi:hypothetical protein AGLY_010892 [Aphis glycines]|uniref:Uncharacterized protein n=1 Tax=Aphis glycines TaxID=307491 RepID=A0A6G0TEW6_APHGL|nr:hypothetical protein AGLY_010892 [Aphis glycines]
MFYIQIIFQKYPFARNKLTDYHVLKNNLFSENVWLLVIEGQYCNVILNIYFSWILTNWIIHTIFIATSYWWRHLLKYSELYFINQTFEIKVIFYNQTSMHSLFRFCYNLKISLCQYEYNLVTSLTLKEIGNYINLTAECFKNSEKNKNKDEGLSKTSSCVHHLTKLDQQLMNCDHQCSMMTGMLNSRKSYQLSKTLDSTATTVARLSVVG